MNHIDWVSQKLTPPDTIESEHTEPATSYICIICLIVLNVPSVTMTVLDLAEVPGKFDNKCFSN